VGKEGCGKSSLLHNLFFGSNCGGIVCLPVIEKGKNIGKNALDIESSKSIVFCRIKEKADFRGISTKKYIINPKALDFCIQTIENSLHKPLILIDEFGILELQGTGLYTVTKKVIESNKNSIIVLRQSLLSRFLKIFPNSFKILQLQ
jgi:nucleoside-triphosphatase THEP1